MELYKNCRVYGPYIRKDGRKHMCIYHDDGRRQTVSYPKYLMENHLGRFLTKDETVDHIDRDFTNDNISNLRIVNQSQHAKDDAKRRKLRSGKCIWCNAFIPVIPRVAKRKGRYKAGPFCSRVCSGEYGVSVQKGAKKLKRKYLNVEYYYNDKQINGSVVQLAADKCLKNIKV